MAFDKDEKAVQWRKRQSIQQTVLEEIAHQQAKKEP